MLQFILFNHKPYQLCRQKMWSQFQFCPSLFSFFLPDPSLCQASALGHRWFKLIMWALPRLQRKHSAGHCAERVHLSAGTWEQHYRRWCCAALSPVSLLLKDPEWGSVFGGRVDGEDEKRRGQCRGTWGWKEGIWYHRYTAIITEWADENQCKNSTIERERREIWIM